jgi:hypothetical protein
LDKKTHLESELELGHDSHHLPWTPAGQLLGGAIRTLDRRFALKTELMRDVQATGGEGNEDSAIFWVGHSSVARKAFLQASGHHQ